MPVIACVNFKFCKLLQFLLETTEHYQAVLHINFSTTY